MSADLTWKELEHRFRELQAEMTADGLMAWYTRFCWDDGPTEEQWLYRGGGARNQKRFESLATAGATKLGFTDNANADNGWLARVREYLGAKITVTGTQIVDGRTATTEGESIERIAGASADYCLQLIASETPESPVSTHFEPVTSEEAWELMRNDFTLRQQLISPELKKQFQPEITAIYSRQTAGGGEGAWIHARAALEINQTDRTAERYFNACCEVWDVQGRRRCRAFFLCVLHYCLIPLFASRRGFFFAEMQGRHSQLGTNLADHLRYFHQEMDKLRSEWSTRIDIASLNNEYQSNILRQSQLDSPGRATPKPRAPSPAKLKRMKAIFGALQLGHEGLAYCRDVDRERPPIPPVWLGNGWPGSYAKAYSDPKWTKRIQDQKSKIQKQYDAMSAKQREKIIQGN
jgi:hypothetical protein